MAAPPHDRTADAVRLFHALSDETRVEIVKRLAAEGERCVCDLQDAMDAGQSRLSFHLRVLKDAGIVEDRREGRWSYYALVPSAFDDAAEILKELKPRTRRLNVKCC
jgi:ArsR family transcriptional regulator, arsenate/arsenite/antimonite-responsive transcriptional repressor